MAKLSRSEACRRWRERNPERARELNHKYDARPGRKEQKRRLWRAWYAANKERVREEAKQRVAAARLSDPVAFNAQRRAKYADDPSAAKTAYHRRRARLAAVENTLTAQEWRAILEAAGHRCVYCGRQGRMTQDHVIPLSKNGGHTAANVVPACRSCNSKKKDKLQTEIGEGVVISTN